MQDLRQVNMREREENAALDYSQKGEKDDKQDEERRNNHNQQRKQTARDQKDELRTGINIAMDPTNPSRDENRTDSTTMVILTCSAASGVGIRDD